MAKSSERDKAEGALYKVGGRALQAIGFLSGDRKKKVKGRLGRGKGSVKDSEGRLKDLFGQWLRDKERRRPALSFLLTLG